MKKKVVAIASADWHIHRYQRFDKDDSRLQWCISAGREIMEFAIKYDVPLLFAGDLAHTPKILENLTNTKIQRLFDDWDRTSNQKFVAISGNHDMCEINGHANISPSHLNSINRTNFVNIDYYDEVYSIGDLKIWGVPYMNNDMDLKLRVDAYRQEAKHTTGFKILMLHSDLPGAKTPDGFIVGETEHIPGRLDKFFKEWDLVIAGHIHKPQQLGKKVWMLGCPIPQDLSNKEDLGYWKIYDDKTIKFVPLKNYPKFIQLKKGEGIPQNSINYYLPYGEVLEEENIEVGEFNINLPKVKLARQYIAKMNIKSKSKKRALIEILNTIE